MFNKTETTETYINNDCSIVKVVNYNGYSGEYNYSVDVYDWDICDRIESIEATAQTIDDIYNATIRKYQDLLA